MRIHQISPNVRVGGVFRTAIFAITAVALSLATAQTNAHAGSEPRLAAGPYAVLQGVLKKTFLRLDVARVRIRVDEDAQRKLAALVSGRKRSKALEDGVVRAVMSTRTAVITSELRRDVPLAKYSESVFEDLRSARASGLIGDKTYWSLARLLPEWFRTLQGRGPRKGDQFMCHMQPGSLRVRYSTSNGVALVDRTIASADLGLAVLGSYFAPDSDIRDELLHSIFRR